MTDKSEQVLQHSINDEDQKVTEIESLCFNCHNTGTTRLLLTKLRFFNEVLVSSFSCPHCGFENKSVDPVGSIQPKGQLIELHVESKRDLTRHVARPSHSVLILPDLGEFPSRDGSVTTIEGLITEVIDKIEDGQEDRAKSNETLFHQLNNVTAKLKSLLLVEEPFTLKLDDPSGNALLENPCAPAKDPQIKTTNYIRTHEQNTTLGYEENQPELTPEEHNKEECENFRPEEVMVIDSPCPVCNSPCQQNMKSVSIPHFREIILMAISCDKCGFRDSEVKCGGGIEGKGRRYNLHITSVSDLKRDVLKSETASIRIPEIDFEAVSGTLNDRFTTVEGILIAIRDDLTERNPFVFGDSASRERQALKVTTDRLRDIIDGKLLDVHFILDDIAGHSYIQNYYAPDPDPEMEVVEYVRTKEQDDELGISDMRTENYEEDAQTPTS